MTLQHLDFIWRDDKEVVLIACSQNGCALQWASNALKADREVVRRALTSPTVEQDTVNHGIPYEFASEILRADKELFLIANTRDRRSILFISGDLPIDQDILQALNTHSVEQLILVLYLGLAIGENARVIRLLLHNTNITITNAISRRIWWSVYGYSNFNGLYQTRNQRFQREEIIELLLNDSRIHFCITEIYYLQRFWYIPRVKRWIKFGLKWETAYFRSETWMKQPQLFDQLLDEIEMVAWIPTAWTKDEVQPHPLFQGLNELTIKGGFRFREMIADFKFQ
ncbi:MAG: DUF4116 domain-containing protein [Sphingobacteriaceae bacterium]|nr:MAG: DUF4116 domain-containing protein [Sphingobacteriaceae bacterium]